MPITEEARNLIFSRLKKNLEKFTPPMVETTGLAHHHYELIGNKPVPYGYNKKIIPGMFFAAVAQRKDSVAFHFYPCYMNADLKKSAPSLYKYLKGKTCFHFRKPEEVNEKELNALLKKGAAAWKKAGYVK